MGFLLFLVRPYVFVELQASFVVCRVFAKSRAGNSISDNGLSSCAEEGVSAVRHIGIQHDEYFTSDTVEAKLHDDNSVDRNSEIPRYPMQLVGELDDPAMTRPISVASLPFRSGMQPMEPVTYKHLSYPNSNISSVYYVPFYFANTFSCHFGILYWILC